MGDYERIDAHMDGVTGDLQEALDWAAKRRAESRAAEQVAAPVPELMASAQLLIRDYLTMHDNLTATQARCTALLEENRKLRVAADMNKLEREEGNEIMFEMNREIEALRARVADLESRLGVAAANPVAKVGQRYALELTVSAVDTDNGFVTFEGGPIGAGYELDDSGRLDAAFRLVSEAPIEALTAEAEKLGMYK